MTLVVGKNGWGDLPRDKKFPPDAVQCHDCGGLGEGRDTPDCTSCDGKGWLPAGHPRGRTCYRSECKNPIPPAQVAVYCSSACAMDDA